MADFLAALLGGFAGVLPGRRSRWYWPAVAGYVLLALAAVACTVLLLVNG